MALCFTLSWNFADAGFFKAGDFKIGLIFQRWDLFTVSHNRVVFYTKKIGNATQKKHQDCKNSHPQLTWRKPAFPTPPFCLPNCRRGLSLPGIETGVQNGYPNLTKCSCFSGMRGWAARHLYPFNNKVQLERLSKCLQSDALRNISYLKK